MSVENDIFTKLSSLVGNRVAPIVFPQYPTEPTWPAIRYSFPSVVPGADICGAGDDETAEIVVQLDVVAKTYPAVRTLRLQVIAAMETFSPPAILTFNTSEFDETTKTYREILQYALQGSSSADSP